MVPKFSIILDNYKQHCVSRSALMLHLHGTRTQDMPQALQQVGASVHGRAFVPAVTYFTAHEAFCP